MGKRNRASAASDTRARNRTEPKRGTADRDSRDSFSGGSGSGSDQDEFGDSEAFAGGSGGVSGGGSGGGSGGSFGRGSETAFDRLDRRVLVLRERRAELIEQAGSLLDGIEQAGREISDDEQKRHQALLDEAEQVRRRADRYQRQIDASRELDDDEPPAVESAATHRSRLGRPDRFDDAPRITMPRLAGLRAFRGDDGERDAFTAGRWLMAQFFGSLESQRWCRENGVEYFALGTNVNKSGGFLVPEGFNEAVIDQRELYGALRQIARVVPMSSDVEAWPRLTSGATVQYPAEGGTITESQQVFDRVQLVARKAAVLTPVNRELSEDAAPMIADLLAMDFGRQFAKAEDDAGLIGDGTNTYGGIQGVNNKFEADTTLAGFVTAATATNDTIPEIDDTDLTVAMGTLPMFAMPGAAWVMSSVFWAHVVDVITNLGGTTGAQATEGVRRSLYGIPVVISQSMPANRSTDYSNKVIALLGDFTQGVYLGDRRRFEIQVDESIGFREDQIYFRATQRFDINAHGLGDSTNAGPIIALAGGTS